MKSKKTKLLICRNFKKLHCSLKLSLIAGTMAQAVDEKQAEMEDYMKDFCTVGREKNYRDQAIFYLNAMWAEYGNDAETFWGYVELAAELDKDKGENGNAMDEFQVCCISIPIHIPISRSFHFHFLLDSIICHLSSSNHLKGSSIPREARTGPYRGGNASGIEKD